MSSKQITFNETGGEVVHADMQPDDLHGISQRINAATDRAEGYARSAMDHALEAGGLLIEAKKLLKHGEWDDWLTTNCTVAPRTARAYMGLAKSIPLLEDSKRQRVADLPLREAIKAIATNPNAKERPPSSYSTGVFIAKRDDRMRATDVMKKSASALKNTAVKMESRMGLKAVELNALHVKMVKAIEALYKLVDENKDVTIDAAEVAHE